MKSADARSRFRILLFLTLPLFAGVGAGYYQVLHSPFNFDDGLVVLNNETIRTLDHFFQTHTLHYRHLFYLTFAWNYHLGQEDPFGYHLFNIGVHLLACLPVFLIARVTVEKGMGRDAASALRVACVTTLAFALNPIQTEAVSYISGRTSSMMAMLYLFSLSGFILAELKSTRLAGRIGGYVLCVVCGGMALLSKETAVTLPASIFLYDLCFMRNAHFRPFKPRLLWIYAPILLALGGVVFKSANLQERIVTWLGRTNPGYALQQLTVIPFGAKMVLFPINQVFDYDWPYATLSTDTLRIVSSLGALALLGFIWYRLYRAWPLAAFGLGWFLIVLSPTNSFLPRMDLLSERNLYLPSFGLLLWGAGFADWVGFNPGRSPLFRKIAAACMAVTIACFAVLLVHRNAVYESNITLWEDALKKNPGKPRIYHNLSHFYTEAKDFENAFIMLKKLAASNATPYYRSYAHTNLGNIYALWGDMQNAEREFIQAVDIYPNLPSGHFNLGVLFATKGMDREANAAFDRARETRKFHPDKNLLPVKVALYKARVLFNLKRYAEAEREARLYLSEKPGNENGILLLGQILDANGKAGEAIALLQSVQGGSPQFLATVQASLAHLHIEQQDWNRAIGWLKRSVQTDPSNAPRQFALGRLMWRQQKNPAAARHLKQAIALQLDPASTLEAETLLTEIESAGDQEKD
ncbi:MAG: hypothetical protein KC553_06820 [Nitrospina sp.]|nr:hypothetical protein [Nitrospina sp.]